MGTAERAEGEQVDEGLSDLASRMEREREYWRTSETERPGELPVPLLLRKMTEARVFFEAFERNRSVFESADAILEVGGGQGWAACLVKRMLGADAKVMTSDIGEAAVQSVPVWESMFQTKLDGAFACPALDIPLPDSSLDLVFAFDAAHHFGAHRRTLAEIERVLVPGGACLYLHEPTAPRFIYRLAVERVNRKRAGYGHDVVEDVLVGDHLLEIATELGYDARRTFAPSRIGRERKAALYYSVVKKLGRAQRCVPSAADFVFTKRA